MPLAMVHSRALAGINAPLISVEVHISNGLPAMSIVGLPEMAVRESKDRVRAAITNSGFDFPQRKVTVSLAPADLPKEGGRFDLAIALGVLAASQQIPTTALEGYEFVGELALSGAIRSVRGCLPSALHCADSKRQLVVPVDDASEASLAKHARVLAAPTLLHLCQHLTQQQQLSLYKQDCQQQQHANGADMLEVKGQAHAKRALEIAAAGGHNLLMVGPPGTGKTMLASRLPGILPSMTDNEALETAALWSISNEGFDFKRWAMRPFRAPHHTASAVALVGGGSIPRPGEVSLAHNGVLFLDELPEFNRRVLEVLREPMERGHITISRAARQAEFPSRCQLIAAMNPCPCGYLGDNTVECRCSPDQINRYRNKISGPILDRIDIHISVPRLPLHDIQTSTQTGETSSAIKSRVTNSRKLQLQRAGVYNAQMNQQQLQEYCRLNTKAQTIINSACEKMGFSARAYDRILKVARTIADLEQVELIAEQHISEAIALRGISY